MDLEKTDGNSQSKTFGDQDFTFKRNNAFPSLPDVLVLLREVPVDAAVSALSSLLLLLLFVSKISDIFY